MTAIHEPEANAQRYKELCARMLSREPVTADEFLEHFDIQDEGATSGPEIGTIAPSIRAADQSGAVRAFADLCGPRGLLLVFVRSVYWCPYCRNQLGDLVREYEAVRATGVEIAVVAPDSGERVAEFAQRYKPGFPILCDESGDIVRAYELSNPNIVGAPHMTSVDVPYPGHLLIASDGRVVDKSFTGDLRHRASATLLVSRSVGDTGGPTARIEGDVGAFEVALSAGHIYGGQELGLRIEVEPKPGWHVYAPGCPDNYQPLTVNIDTELLDDVEFQYPLAETVILDGLGEEAAFYAKPVTIQARLRVRWRPELFWKSENGLEPLRGLEELAALRPNAGSFPIRVRITYQACSDETCLPPTSTEVELPLELFDDVPAASIIRPQL
jgi:peroxiredoxin